MMQSMGNSPVGMDMILPFLMMDQQDSDSNLLLMVMLNSMTGGMNSQQGFDNNFNMLLPLMMQKDCAGNLFSIKRYKEKSTELNF